MSAMPGYWMHEQSGVLRPVVTAYLEGKQLTAYQVSLMRSYLRQWIESPEWQGENIDLLRATVGSLTTRRDIENWLEVADRAGIDPL